MRRCAFALALTLAAGCVSHASEFDGTWVFRASGLNILKLTLSTEHGVVSGSITKPKSLSLDEDGEVTQIGPGVTTLPVQKSKLEPKRLELTIDGDLFVMTITGRDTASFAIEHIRPLNLGRVAGDGSAVVLATSLPEPKYPPKITALREQLRSMVKEDQDARMAFNVPQMDAVDQKNRPVILEIFGKYGWITRPLAGKDAAHDFWLLVQHQNLDLQERLLAALESAARAGEASMKDYAYLYDRVQVGQGKPQHWGSQVKCVDGKPVLSPVDDLAGLDARRKELFLPPIAEYLQMDYLVQNCKEQTKKP